MKISVVTPMLNEAESFPHLYEELVRVLEKTGNSFEIIAVNDGSTDNTDQVLKAYAEKDKRLKVIRFTVRRGQTAGLSAGIHHASGDVIVTIDSDLENNPDDIPKLLKKLEEGYDIVTGWRQGRWADQRFTRKIPSMAANKLISKISGLTLNDNGCTLKVYRRSVFDGIELYGEMHRFIPAYLVSRGAKVAELPVDHRPRRFGESKYGFSRVFRVLLDLVLMKFLNKYMNRPMHFFGGIGFISLFLGFIAGSASIVLKIFHVRDFVSTPLPIFSALLIIVGVQLVVMGVLAEMLMRTYYESQRKYPYLIKEKVNFD